MNIKIIDKNGVTLKTKGKYCKEDISVSVDESILGGAGAVIKTKGGWTGTAVPSSGTAGNVYFNKDMPTEQVTAIFDSIAMFNTGEGVYLTAFIYNNAQVDDSDYTNGIMLYKFDDGTGASYQMVLNIDNSETPLFQSGPYFADSFQGWNPNFVEDEMPFDYENQLTALVALGVKIENERVSSVLSSTPFTFTPGETITLEGEYDGDTVSIGDLSGSWKGTIVPNTGYVEKIYINTSLTNDEVNGLLTKLQYHSTSDLQFDIYTIATIGSNKGINILYGNGGYVILYNGLNTLYDSGGGWADTAISELELNGNIPTNLDIPIGEQNDTLLSLFSITPFTKSEANTINLKPYIDKKQIPLNIKVNAPKGAIIKGGGWKGTPVPNEGPVEKIYFNTELTYLEIVNIIEESNLTFIDIPGASSYYPILFNSSNYYAYVINKMEDDEYRIEIVNFATTTLVEIICHEFVGWSSTFNGVVEFNPSVETLSEFSGIPVGVSNKKLSSLFSITPFENIEDVKLEGEYDGSTVEVTDLRKWEGKTVPNTGYVEDVYFNSELSIEKVDYLLSRLTYTQTTLHDKPISPLLLTEKYQALGAVKFNDGYALVYMNLTSGVQLPCYCSSPSAGTTVLGWLMEEDKKDLPQIFDSNALSEYGGLQVGSDNDKLSSLISITPFTQVEDKFIDMRPYIEDKKIPLKVNVNVETGITPTGTYEVTDNGEYDITEYAKVNVNVAGSGGDTTQVDALIEKTITEYSSSIVTTIGQYAFYDCKELTDINMPSVTKINSYAFQNCSSLVNVNVENATVLGSNSFYGCSSLKSIYLPNVITVNSNSFYGCSSLKSIYLPNATALNGYTFQNCTALISANVPKNKNFMNGVFAGCTLLKSVNMADASTLYAYAFENCHSLKALIIQTKSRICTANASSFFKCYHILGTVNETYNPNGDKDGYIYVPDSKLDSYKQSSSWASFVDQIKPLSELPQEYKDLYNIA